MSSRLCRLAAIGLVVVLSSLSLAQVAVAKSVEEIAWQRAAKLAKVSASEVKEWPKPIVTIYPSPRYEPISDTDGYRVCGRFVPYLEGDREAGLKMVYSIEVYAKPSGEEQLILDGLTHEFLHFIWLQRAIVDPSWELKHPSTETYTRELLPAECPNQ